MLAKGAGNKQDRFDRGETRTAKKTNQQDQRGIEEAGNGNILET
jgi:hypothetical protein